MVQHTWIGLSTHMVGTADTGPCLGTSLIVDCSGTELQERACGTTTSGSTTEANHFFDALIGY